MFQNKIISKFSTLLILIFLSFHTHCYDLDSWDSTEYIYLVKPIYIYKIESQAEVLSGELGNSLNDLVVKIQYKEKSKNFVYYNFKVEEVLFGEPKNNIFLKFEFHGDYTKCNLNNSFNNHEDNMFWKTELGRSTFSPNKKTYTNCFGKPKDTRQVTTCFEIDKLYLLIKNDEIKTKQYELIEIDNDKWLMYIRKKIEEFTNS